MFFARLAQKMAFWVMCSIFIIELIIVIPSYIVREQVLLDGLEKIGLASVRPIIHLVDLTNDQANFTLMGQELTSGTVIVGGSIYENDGTLLDTFGEPPTLTLDDLAGNETWEDMVRFRRYVRHPSLSFYVDKVARRRWFNAHNIPAP